ncbi:MAG: hypothetical protein H6765_08075 [Candidatus Peribacteria bacterium]|nr:MAG: hypothetical protein H6765_08075 [Candidatus Peribacteria bacterium]
MSEFMNIAKSKTTLYKNENIGQVLLKVNDMQASPCSYPKRIPQHFDYLPVTTI